MKKLFLFVIIIIMISSCWQKNDQKDANNTDVTNNIENIQIDENKNKLHYKELVAEIKLLQLNPSETDFFIQEINQVFVTDSLIFVVDVSQKRIFVFDREGNPSHKIGEIGNGPGEYTDISSVSIDRDQRKIYLYNTGDGSVLSYDFRGRFVSKWTASGSGFYFLTKVPHSDLFIGERRKYGEKILAGVDQDNNITASTLMMKEEKFRPLMYFISNPLFYANEKENKVYYPSVFDYSIYSFADNTFKKEYTLGFPLEQTLYSSSANQPAIGISPFEAVQSYLNQGLICILSNLIVSDRYVAIRVWGGSVGSNLLYDRKKKRSVFYGNLLSEDLDSGFPQPAFIAEHNGYFVFMIDFEHGYEYLRENKLVDLPEDPNPVLVFVKLKESWGDDKND